MVVLLCQVRTRDDKSIVIYSNSGEGAEANTFWLGGFGARIR
jgi:hypothetical protein